MYIDSRFIGQQFRDLPLTGSCCPVSNFAMVGNREQSLVEGWAFRGGIAVPTSAGWIMEEYKNNE